MERDKWLCFLTYSIKLVKVFAETVVDSNFESGFSGSVMLPLKYPNSSSVGSMVLQIKDKWIKISVSFWCWYLHMCIKSYVPLRKNAHSWRFLDWHNLLRFVVEIVGFSQILGSGFNKSFGMKDVNDSNEMNKNPVRDILACFYTL